MTLLARVVHREGAKPDTTYPIEGLHRGEVGEAILHVEGGQIQHIDLDEYEIVIDYSVP